MDKLELLITVNAIFAVILFIILILLAFLYYYLSKLASNIEEAESDPQSEGLVLVEMEKISVPIETEPFDEDTEDPESFFSREFDFETLVENYVEDDEEFTEDLVGEADDADEHRVHPKK